MKQHIPLTLNIIALIAASVLVGTHFHYEDPSTIVFAIVALGAGYLFGTWTCHLHKKVGGFWITIGLFITLNILHSMIDGASIGGMSSMSSAVAVLSHEAARQPALYIVLWGMLTPFVSHKPSRLLITPVAVTGVWILGMYMGDTLLSNVQEIGWIEQVADMAGFLFIGDIIHHIIEEYRKRNRATTCCHETL